MNKKIIIIISTIALLVLGLLIENVKDVKIVKVKNDIKLSQDKELSQEQKALQQVAYAYYKKSNKIQYDSQRSSYNQSPEEATSQNKLYMVCSSFTFQIYYQTLGIIIPNKTTFLTSYAYNNKSNEDVILSLKGDEFKKQVSTEESRKKFASDLLEIYNLQVGDIIVWSSGNYGHALFVYDIVYDKDGKPVEAKILNSTSNFEKTNNKLYRGLSYSNNLNKETNVYEGTVQMTSLEKTINSSKQFAYFSIIRPLIKDNDGTYKKQYNYATCENQKSSSVDDTVCTFSKENYDLTKASKSRLKYNDIEIEKTVDKFNKSTVEPGDILTYTLTIKNNSNYDYKNLSIVENVPENTYLFENGNDNINKDKLNWNVDISKNSQIQIKYSVHVKNDNDLTSKTIISEGYVDNIATSKVINYINKNLKEEEKNKIIESYNKLKNNYSGRKLINEIYKDALNTNLNLENFDLDNLINMNETTMSSTDLNINENNEFYKIVLPNYYGGLYKTKSGEYYLKMWENSIFGKRHQRNDTINKENLQTGDILIYKNIENGKENGEYSFIYINDTFYGNNNETNEIQSQKYTPNGNDFLQTILAKDKYVILRPASIIKKDNSKDNINNDNNNIIDSKDNITLPLEKKENSIKDKTINNPKTGVRIPNFIYIILALAIIGLIIVRKIKLFKKI